MPIVRLGLIPALLEPGLPNDAYRSRPNFGALELPTTCIFK
jgi:hypothetical protein